MDLKNLIGEAQKAGTKLLVVRLGDNPEVATTEPMSALGTIFAEALAVAARALSARTSYTSEEVLQAILKTAAAGARRRLASDQKVESQSQG